MPHRCHFSKIPIKLVLREDITVPPYSSAIPVFCGTVFERSVLFTPSELFMSRKDIPLPFATLDISTGFSSIVVCNLLPTTLKALCGEALGRVQPLGDMHRVLRPTQNSLNFAHFLLMPSHQLTYSFFSLLIRATLTASSPACPVSFFRCRSASLLRVAHRLSVTTSILAPTCHCSSTRTVRVSAKERQVISEHVDDMLQRSVIRLSNSPWPSPVVLVTKIDASIWFCVVYRRLNKITQ